MSSTKCLLDRNYILATLLKTKRKYSGKFYVYPNECEKLEQIIVNELENRNITVKVEQEIDSNYFTEYDTFFIQKNGSEESLNSLIEKYRSESSLQVVSILDDIDYIQNIMYFEEGQEKIVFTPAKLENIIDKIIDNPKVFYEKIADCLSEEEIKFIKRFIVKNCFTCENNTCENKNEYSVINCESWINKEQIGRAKMLKKDHE